MIQWLSFFDYLSINFLRVVLYHKWIHGRKKKYFIFNLRIFFFRRMLEKKESYSSCWYFFSWVLDQLDIVLIHSPHHVILVRDNPYALSTFITDIRLTMDLSKTFRTTSWEYTTIPFSRLLPDLYHPYYFMVVPWGFWQLNYPSYLLFRYSANIFIKLCVSDSLVSLLIFPRNLTRCGYKTDDISFVESFLVIQYCPRREKWITWYFQLMWRKWMIILNHALTQSCSLCYQWPCHVSGSACVPFKSFFFPDIPDYSSTMSCYRQIFPTLLDNIHDTDWDGINSLY